MADGLSESFASGEEVHGVARIVKALGDSRRLKLLRTLINGEFSIGELRDSVGSSYVNVTYHLEILEQSGLIARRQRAGGHFYRIEEKLVYELVSLITEFM